MSFLFFFRRKKFNFLKLQMRVTYLISIFFCLQVQLPVTVISLIFSVSACSLFFLCYFCLCLLFFCLFVCLFVSACCSFVLFLFLYLFFLFVFIFSVSFWFSVFSFFSPVFPYFSFCVSFLLPLPVFLPITFLPFPVFVSSHPVLLFPCFMSPRFSVSAFLSRPVFCFLYYCFPDSVFLIFSLFLSRLFFLRFSVRAYLF